MPCSRPTPGATTGRPGSWTRAGAPRRTRARAAWPGRAGAPAPATPCRATSSPGPASSTRWPRPTRRGRASSPSACCSRWPPATPRAATAAGRQSAAIVVVSPGGGYGGNDDRLVDLRTDDHPDPVGELRRLYDIHILLTGTTPEDQKLPLDGALGEEVRELLARAGYPGEDGAPPERRVARVRRHREPRGALVARGPARSRRARAPALARRRLSDRGISRRARSRPIASR